MVEEKLVSPAATPTAEKEENKTLQTRIFTVYDVPLEDDFQIWLNELCKEKEIEYSLILAMAEQESGFNEKAVGTAGELGMWQIKAMTVEEAEKELGRRLNLFDKYDNAKAAVTLMHKYMNKYGDSIKALMAYNMGEAGAKRCWESDIPKSEYAVDVLEKAAGYQEKVTIIQVVEDDV